MNNVHGKAPASGVALRVALVCAWTILCASGCFYRYRRYETLFPATAGPGQLALSLSVPKRQIRAGQPFVVTVALVNQTDTVCIAPLGGWAYDGPAGLKLVGPRGDTWVHRRKGGVLAMGWLGPGLFGIGPRDSVYRRYTLWPQTFFHGRDSSRLPVGSYELLSQVGQRWILDRTTRQDTWFTLTDTIWVIVVHDSDFAVRFEPYRGLLDRWFDPDPYRRNLEKAARETLLSLSSKLVPDRDSSLGYVGGLLMDIAVYQGPTNEGMIVAQRMREAYPSGHFHENASEMLPRLSWTHDDTATSDSLLQQLLMRYPKNAAALSYMEGRRLWYTRYPVPPMQMRRRCSFLGIPGAWGPWTYWRWHRLPSAERWRLNVE